MRNLKQVLSFFILLSFFSPSSVFAVDKNLTETQIKVQKEKLKTEFKNLKPTLKQQITETKKKQLDRIYQNTLIQFSQRFDNLLQLKTKLEARIKIKESQKKDMTLAKKKLAEFVQLTANYQNDLALFKSRFESVTSSEVPLKSVSEIRLVANKIRLDLNLIKKNLVEVITLIAQG